jgi:hypothetical protein
MSAPRQPSLARRRITALLRLLTVPLVTVGLHSVTRFSPWLLVPLGSVAAALVAGTDFAVPGFRFLSRLNRVDRLAIWIVLVCLIVIGYLHNANTWTADERGFGTPADISMWKTELILGISLAVPLLHTLARLVRPDAGGSPGQQFAREFALYINFSGIALILWSGDAVLSRAMVATLMGWAALAELTLYASE